jgi:Uma2 family endonuclease
MDSRLLRSDELGIRLEIVRGLPLWEASPAYNHQRAVDLVRASIRPCEGSACACVHVADVYIEFPDGSLKRPDISVFCREPEATDEALTVVPEAVIEIISKGYEAKDLDIGPPFYLSQGVRDVVVFNPYNGEARHFREGRETVRKSPAEIELLCGCRCTV